MDNKRDSVVENPLPVFGRSFPNLPEDIVNSDVHKYVNKME